MLDGIESRAAWKLRLPSGPALSSAMMGAALQRIPNILQLQNEAANSGTRNRKSPSRLRQRI